MLMVLTSKEWHFLLLVFYVSMPVRILPKEQIQMDRFMDG